MNSCHGVGIVYPRQLRVSQIFQVFQNAWDIFRALGSWVIASPQSSKSGSATTLSETGPPRMPLLLVLELKFSTPKGVLAFRNLGTIIMCALLLL